MSEKQRVVVVYSCEALADVGAYSANVVDRDFVVTWHGMSNADMLNSGAVSRIVADCNQQHAVAVVYHDQDSSNGRYFSIAMAIIQQTAKSGIPVYVVWGVAGLVPAGFGDCKMIVGRNIYKGLRTLFTELKQPKPPAEPATPAAQPPKAPAIDGPTAVLFSRWKSSNADEKLIDMIVGRVLYDATAEARECIEIGKQQTWEECTTAVKVYYAHIASHLIDTRRVPMLFELFGQLHEMCEIANEGKLQQFRAESLVRLARVTRQAIEDTKLQPPADPADQAAQQQYEAAAEVHQTYYRVAADKLPKWNELPTNVKQFWRSMTIDGQIAK